MSLVERALKKLQESRTASSAVDTLPNAHVDAEASDGLRSDAGHAEVQKPPKARPTRSVTIDKNALRAMELLPPAEFERQIASQYQHVKRTLVANAMGKAGEPIANGHAIMLASALPGEGKTFCSLNLALSIAREKDTEVVLVDADVAKPHVTKIFDLKGERGLLDLLTDSELDPDSVILPTNVPGLSILPAGTARENATELLASERMEQLVAALQGTDGHRIALFDSPPLLLSTESRALIPTMGQIVLVVRAGFTPQRAVDDALDAVGEGRHVSLILNQATDPGSGGYYGYGTYGDDASSK